MEDRELSYDNSTPRIRVFFCPWDKKSGMESHELLRRAVGLYLGSDPETFSVCRDGEHGKPYLAGFLDVHFSITHSGGFWACAVGPDEVGLDIQEEMDNDTQAIAKRFFHPSEISWLETNGWEDFFRIWTMKESFIKFTGKGLMEGLDHFSVIDGVPACQQEIPFRDGYWMILTTEFEDAFCLEELQDTD